MAKAVKNVARSALDQARRVARRNAIPYCVQAVMNDKSAPCTTGSTRIFIDQSMHRARSGENDFRVIVVGHTAGRIFATLRSSGRHVWLWTVTGPYLPGAGLNGSGDAEDLPEARTAFRSTFDAWHSWAIRQNAPIKWHE